jgi:hypothetical protein
MRITRFTIAALVFAMASCLASTAAARAQAAQADGHKVSGVMDLQSGRFTPVTGEHVVPETSTTMFTTGTIELTITVNLVSDFPPLTQISCGMDVDVTAQNLTDGALGKWMETATSVARVHGVTATCTLIIPYYWLLPTAAENEVRTLTGRFMVSATQPGLQPTILRSTNQPFLSTTVIPSNQTVSKYRVNATI